MTGSTSKTVSPVSSRGTGVSGAGLRSGEVVSRRRIPRACSKARPSRFRPHQESGEEAGGSQIVVRAGFGKAAVAGSNKGKLHLLVLGEFCKVAM